ncbi:MAG: ketopantoate reductase family protein [Candidatus Velthaea sp.]
MRFCVVGAGAIGAYVGAQLQRSGADVAFIARGAHLEALQKEGLTVNEPGHSYHLDVAAYESGMRLPGIDAVLLAVKSHQVAHAVLAVTALYGRDTIVVTLQNGVPWWYPFRHPVAAGWSIESVDAGGAIAAALDPQRAVGCAVYFSAHIARPGVVNHTNDRGLVLGEPAGGASQRVDALVDALRRADFDARADAHIRAEIWSKLLGNVNFNPISALTRAYIGEIASDAQTAEVVREMMDEALAVATALGDAPGISIDNRIATSPRSGNVRTSMLQDVEAGRRLEIGPIIGAVVELADRTATPVPLTRRILALAVLLDRSIARQRNEASR